MNSYLLDTNAVVFIHTDDKRLSRAAKQSVCAPEAVIYVSAISIAELACAQARKKLLLDGHWKTWFRRLLDENGWSCLPVSQEIVEEAYSLPDFLNPDPADRILVATARIHSLTVVTTDRKILDYPHVNAIG